MNFRITCLGVFTKLFFLRNFKFMRSASSVLHVLKLSQSNQKSEIGISLYPLIRLWDLDIDWAQILLKSWFHLLSKCVTENLQYGFIFNNSVFGKVQTTVQGRHKGIDGHVERAKNLNMAIISYHSAQGTGHRWVDRRYSWPLHELMHAWYITWTMVEHSSNTQYSDKISVQKLKIRERGVLAKPACN